MMLKIARMCCLLLLVTGCSVKFAYNNLDRVAGWVAADFVDFSSDQEDYFEAEIDGLLYWHRKTQLPEYARLMRDLANNVDQPPTLDDFERIEKRVQTWAENIINRSLPMTSTLLRSLDDEQVTRLAENFGVNNDELLEPAAEMSELQRREKFEENVADAYKRFIGKLTEEQNQLLNTYAREHILEEEQWVAYRVMWQKDLLELLRIRQNSDQFNSEFEYMSTHLSEWYGEEFTRTLADNEALRRLAGSSMLASLTAKQRRKMQSRLNDLAEAFEELAADDSPAPKPAPDLVSCLVSCS